MAVTHPPDLTMSADAPQMFDNDAGDQCVNVGRCRFAGYINSVELIPNWTMSGANTNSRTYTLYNRGTSGSGTTAIATLALVSGVNLTKFQSKAITITGANAQVAVGDVLEWESLHVGTGLPDPGGKVIVQQSLGV